MTRYDVHRGSSGRMSITLAGRMLGWTQPGLGGVWEAYWRDADHQLHTRATANADDAASVLRREIGA